MHGTLAEATSSSIAGTGLYIRKKSSNRLPSLVGIQFPGFGVLDKWMVQLPSVFFATLAELYEYRFNEFGTRWWSAP